MTHKFIYVRDLENFSPQSVVYYIFIGESEAEVRRMRIINTYASVSGAWFEKVSSSVMERLIQLSGRFTSTFDNVCVEYQSAYVSSNEFVRILKGQGLKSYESSLMESNAKNLMRFMLSSDFHLMCMAKGKIKPLLSLARKNLSPEYRSELGRAVVGFGLILAFGLLSAILDAIEASGMIY